MSSNRNTYFLILSLWIWTTIWLFGIIEITTLVSYRHCFTAGELLAWITANGYETGDIINYCLRHVWPYWLGCTLLFAMGCAWICVVRKKNKKWRISTIVALVLFLLPFVIPSQPWCLAREIVCVVQQIQHIRAHHANSENFIYNAKRVDSVENKEIYVLAIGESVRYNNLSLNNTYHRQTTPLLGQQNGLYLYSDCYANATLTQHAMPMLLTPTISMSFAEHFDYKTIAAPYHEAGFYTMLISHRAQLMNNGYHNYLAQDVDSIIWVEHDSLIHSTLRQVMNMHPKLFVITHYLGNHMFYTNRTEDCLVWRPDYNADPNVQSDSLFFNAYDNSILYTDYLLNQEIETLRHFKGIATWFFISDHGEYIDHRVSGHGHTYHPTKDEYHVPLMVWYSDEYAAAYPDKVANMIKHKDEPVCGDHVFWSVLDMAGIEIDSTLQQEGMSIFGDTLLPYQRTLLLPDGKTIMEL